ncbi:MAG: response regulator, partial [Pseudomonadota bacterium]
MNTNPLNLSTPDLDFSGKTMLIVDDYQEMRNIFRDILRSCGADVKKIYTAANGNEAVGLLKRVQFDIVLCD